MASNIAASVAAKLKNHAKANGHDVMVVFRRYAQERFLYRLTVSPEAERFCLKGGMLLAAHNGGDLKRPTNDIDLNIFDDPGTIEDLKNSILSITGHPVDDDGIVFLPESIRVAKDRDGNDGNISGGKIVITALIHTARVEVRIDVGFGNVITPHVTKMKLPTLMPDIAPAPVISTYPMETVVSEKLHAIVQHGLINTRMKDFFDIMRISEMFEFDGDILRQAVESTFASLRRELPLDPIGLSDRMVAVNSKQWAAYVKRQGVETSQDYGEIMEKVARFIEPVIASSHGVSDPGDWHPDEGWSNQRSPQP